MAISLQKGKKVHLKKPSPTKELGEILINLNWNKKTRGFWSSLNHFFQGSNGIDLDLGCLYELKNGYKGTVQALGNAFGSLLHPPYIALDGDDRTGDSSEGENIRIDGKQISNIKRVLVYTFIYEGVANWKEADAIVTIKSKNSEDLIIKPDSFNSKYIMFAIALIENVNDEAFSIEKIAQYYKGHRELDHAFNWGLNWYDASKD